MALLVYVTIAIHSVVSAFPYYTKLSGTYTWSEAKQACQDYGTALATIKDSTDNSKIRSLCGWLCWIGYTTHNHCTDCWYWLGQHTSTYTDWGSGYPGSTNNLCAYYVYYTDEFHRYNYNGVNYYVDEWRSITCSNNNKFYAICNPLITSTPSAAPSFSPTRYGDDCEDRGYIYHYNWDDTSLGQHPYFDYKIDIDASDLSVRFEANLEYIGYSTAKSQYGLGSTYVLDFAPFDGFNDHINKPRNCSNRLPLSFINKSFSEYWRYSTTPYNVNHYGTLDYLAYPPSGDKWSLTMGYGNPWIECARIKYVAYFNWVELNECEDNQGNSLMNIDVDSNFITLSGRFYIDLVSPKSNDKELDVYYVKPILQKSFAMKISRSVQIIDSTNIESFLITIYQSHRLFDNTDSTHGSHLIRISTQIAHYMQLTSPLVITSPTYQWQIRNISDEQCVFERDSICTQYWDVYMVRSVECPLEFAGIYHLHFSAICNLEINDTESCDDYIKAYNGTVELEFSLSYSDPFKCNDTQLEDILFDASMLFYNDINFANLVNNGDQFRSGIDVIYGEVIVDIPSNSLSVFEVSLLNIWTCTVDASLENHVKIDENEIFTGCFDSAIVDAGSTANVMINGKSQLNFDAHLINSENKTNIVRYSFLAPSWVARDILYVHCQIKISLIDHNDRRLLIDNDENVVNFGNIQSIVHVIEGVLIDMENHATTTQITTTKITTIIGEDDIQLSGDSHIDLMT
eukprot:350311_1